MNKLIIDNKYNSAKELINYIIKQKYFNHIDKIRINMENLQLLEDANLVIEWKEYHPCLIWTHKNICGLPIEVIEEKV